MMIDCKNAYKTVPTRYSNAFNVGFNKCQIFSALVFVVCFVLLSFDGSAQIVSSATTTQDTVLIGDPIVVEIKIKVPSNTKIEGIDFSPFLRMKNKVYSQDTVFLDSLADVDVIDWGSWKHSDISLPINPSEYTITNENGQQVISNTIKLAVYNMGIYDIPSPLLVGDLPSSILPGETKSIVVKLPESIMKQDSIPFNPIFDIMKEDADISDYLVYVYILVGLLVLGLLGYYFYRIKKKNVHQPIVEEPILVLSAHEKAYKALQILDDKQLWQQGQIKEYQSELTDIIRQYLFDRFHINAQEMTTDEISQSLSTLDYDSENTNNLREVLQIADLVKFAKALPASDVHSRFMQKAIVFIDKTKKSDNLAS